MVSSCWLMVLVLEEIKNNLNPLTQETQLRTDPPKLKTNKPVTTQPLSRAASLSPSTLPSKAFPIHQ